MEITITKCESSQLIGYGYDPASKTLAIEFHGGAVYHYFDVDPALFDALDKSEKKGSFFMRVIKRTPIRYQKVKERSDAN